jgi:hypothetical protein
MSQTPLQSTGSPPKAWLLLAVTTLFLIAPIFARSFRGYKPEDFPQPITDLPIQPIGWAFSIWSVIYLVLFISALIGVRREANNPVWDAPRWPLILSIGLGISWLEVAQIAPVAATVQILGMCGFALWAVARLPRDDNWLRQPAALYAGWVTAAAGVSVGVVLTGYGVLGAQAAAIVCLVTISVVALLVTHFLKAPRAYPFAASWALFGIIVANLDNGMTIPGIAGLAISALIAVTIMRQTSH